MGRKELEGGAGHDHEAKRQGILGTGPGLRNNPGTSGTSRTCSLHLFDPSSADKNDNPNVASQVSAKKRKNDHTPFIP